MHTYVLSQRPETKVAAITLNLSTNVEALATSGYDEKDAWKSVVLTVFWKFQVKLFYAMSRVESSRLSGVESSRPSEILTLIPTKT